MNQLINSFVIRFTNKVMISLVTAILFVTVAQATDIKAVGGVPTIVGQASSQNESLKPGYSPTIDGKATYIVRFHNPPTAKYDGGIQGFAATSPIALKTKRLDVNRESSKRYASFLREEQDNFVSRSEKSLGRKLNVKFQYQHVFNGIAVELGQREVESLKRERNVVSITRERMEVPLTDVGPDFINADAIWNGDEKDNSSKGEGVVVAILDTGINSDHPSFAEVGGDGYAHKNPLGDGNYIPGSHCDTNPGFCNNKLIGAWGFTKDFGDPLSPEDTDGHGSHTAGTAAGNVIADAGIEAPTTRFSRAITGVAPHANIIAYDVCVTSCPGSALLAAVEQVVIDASVLPNGIHSLNYSISGGDDPYQDFMELAFLNATAAGVFVSASAGNSGPGPETVAHNSPWVTTVAASTHPRSIDNFLQNLTSGGGALGDLKGSGLTAGYGPARIVYAGNYTSPNGTDPAQCLVPFPAGTFNGEIVICDRGTIGRVIKGENVLAGGAGGLVLANTDAWGESIVADSHFLPAVHLGVSNGNTLKAWVSSVANPMASISGYKVNLDPALGDIMAGFSSRGPNTALEIIKPDLSAPGVDIFAADSSFSGKTAPEYQMLSGTSMSSPHNAGAGALVSATTNWTPYEIKSALMMTSKSASKMKKEDGLTPGDLFDAGAGRIQLDKVLKAGLVLNETPDNFIAANPEIGGDPKTLNIASMQDNLCIGSCSWSRIVRNVSGDDNEWKLSVDSSSTVRYSVNPRELALGEGQEARITITADTRLGSAGAWDFAQLNLTPDDNDEDVTKLHMPIAVKPQFTSNSLLLNKTVDKATSKVGDVLNYQILISNTDLGDRISITDTLPVGVEVINNSLTETVVNGSTLSAFSANGNQLNWAGVLDVGAMEVVSAPGTSPAGYLPLSLFGIPPFAKPSDPDEGGLILNVPPFYYNGELISQVIWSVNGTIEAGAISGLAASWLNQLLPDATLPNNILAPLWTDLDMSSAGEWYVARLSGGGAIYTVYEWTNVPLYGIPNIRYSFQLWVQEGTSNIWFTYGRVDEPYIYATVGVEDSTGMLGNSYYVDGNGTPLAAGDELSIRQSVGGKATLSFQAKVKSCSKRDSIISNQVELSSGDVSERAIAVTSCTPTKK